MSESHISRGANRLKKQADLLRQVSRQSWDGSNESELARWKQFVYLLIIVGTLVSVVILLISENNRRQMIASLGEGWIQLSGSQQQNIFRLPPPPPKRPDHKVSRPTFTVTRSKTSEDPPQAIFANPEVTARKEVGTRGRETFGTLTPAAPPKTSTNEQAYGVLREESDLVSQLVGGDLSELEFKTWKPVKDRPPEFWIDITAIRRADGQEMHLIWSVNLESNEITALSQEARDLEGTLQQ